MSDSPRNQGSQDIVNIRDARNDSHLSNSLSGSVTQLGSSTSAETPRFVTHTAAIGHQTGDEALYADNSELLIAVDAADFGDNTAATSDYYGSAASTTNHPWTNSPVVQDPYTYTEPSSWPDIGSTPGVAAFSNKGKQPETSSAPNYDQPDHQQQYQYQHGTNYDQHPPEGEYDDVDMEEMLESAIAAQGGFDIPSTLPMGNAITHGASVPSFQDPEDLKLLPFRFYVVESSWKFQVGDIFLAMDRGEVGAEHKGPLEMTYGELKARRHEKMRRFIVVRTMTGHSDCVAITTYNGKGAAKSGAKLEHHGYVYQEDAPMPTKGNTKWAPIRAILDKPKSMLQRGSIVNYSKIHCIEHNTYVCHIGYIDNSDMTSTVHKALYHAFKKKHCTPPDRDALPGASSRHHHDGRHRSRQ